MHSGAGNESKPVVGSSSQDLIGLILAEHGGLDVSDYDLRKECSFGILMGKDREGDTLVWRVNLQEQHDTNMFDGVLRRLAGLTPVRYLLTLIPNTSNQVELHSYLGAHDTTKVEGNNRLMDYTHKLGILIHDCKLYKKIFDVK